MSTSLGQCQHLFSQTSLAYTGHFCSKGQSNHRTLKFNPNTNTNYAGSKAITYVWKIDLSNKQNTSISFT